MSSKLTTQQIEYDAEARRWGGHFFQLYPGDRVLVPRNALNHPEHRGRSGEVTRYVETDFGMSWVDIRFDDVAVDKPQIDTARTNCIIREPTLESQS